MPKPKGVGIEEITSKDIERVWGLADGKITGRNLENSGLLPDWAIREFVTIDDFVDYGECPKGKISFGLTSAGYDLRVGYKFKVFTNVNCATVDPKAMDPNAFHNVDLTPKPHEFSPDGFCRYGCGTEFEGDDRVANPDRCGGNPIKNYILIPPNSFALAETIEKVFIPKNVTCICLGKSTYARCGINLNFTPFEPGWFGIVTVEIINATPLPVKIYAGEGIGQALFFLMAGTPEKAYGEKKNAKYQDQKGLTLPFVK